MLQTEYRMSFTTGGLFYRESILLTELFLAGRSWDEVGGIVLADNLLQSRTESTAKRILKEVTARVSRLTERQLRLLLSGSRPEQNYILWLSVCKHYAFIRKFAVEVLREKYLCLENVLNHSDYDLFFTHLSGWHAKLEQLSSSTVKKNRSVLFRIMREAELLSTQNLIIPALFTKELASVIADDDASLFTCYPISDRDIKEFL